MTHISAGGQLLTSTFIGGEGDDDGLAGVVVGPGDEVHVLGHTNSRQLVGVSPTGRRSSDPHNSASPTALTASLHGETDLFLLALASGAREVIWAGYLGGCRSELSGGLTRSEGHLYLTGQTFSLDYPLVDPLVGELGGGGFSAITIVTGVNLEDRSIVFSTYFNGNVGRSEGRAIASNGPLVHVGGGAVPFFGRFQGFPVVNATGPTANSFAADGFSTLFVQSRGKLLSSGPEWMRHMRVDSNQSGGPDPADEVITIERSGDTLEIISTRWGHIQVELEQKNEDGLFEKLRFERDRPRAHHATTVELVGLAEGKVESASVVQTRTGIEAATGIIQGVTEQGGTIRFLDQDNDQVFDAISLEPDSGPSITVSVVLVDVDGDGEADFVTVPWGLASLFGVHTTYFQNHFQPFIPLADLDGDGMGKSPAFDFNEDGIADSDFPWAPFSGPDSSTEHELYFAHFGEGADLLFSQLLLFPLRSEGDVNATVILRGNDGSPLEVDLNGEVVRGEKRVVVPACGLLVLETDGKGPVVDGTVTVRSDQPLGGVILFGGVVGVAGVGSSQEVGEGFQTLIEEDQSQQIRSGVAVMGLERRVVKLVFRLLDDKGAEVAVREGEVAALGHLAFFVDQLFDDVDLSDFLGSLIVEADGRVTGTVLQIYPGEFVTMPVAGLGDFGRNLNFAHFGNGADALFSKFLVLNLHESRSGGYSLTALADSGGPLTYVLDGEEVLGTTDLALIEPRGVRRRQTDGQGEVITGSASLFGISAQFAGVIVFGGSLGVAGVGSSPPFPRGFIAPVEADEEEDVDTGIAVRNIGVRQGDNLDLFLHDSTGRLLATSTLTVPVSGHDARFLSQYDWIPEPDVVLDFTSFRGLIKMKSKGAITGTVLQLRGSTQFATMPTSPILD